MHVHLNIYNNYTLIIISLVIRLLAISLFLKYTCEYGKENEHCDNDGQQHSQQNRHYAARQLAGAFLEVGGGQKRRETGINN